MNKKKIIEINLFITIAILSVVFISMCTLYVEKKRDCKKKAPQDSNVSAYVPEKEIETMSQIQTTKEDSLGTSVEDETQKRQDRIIEYKKVLSNIHDHYLLPDGKELNLSQGDNIERNNYAIVDIDSDGQEELLFKFSSTAIANMALYIFDYNEKQNEIIYEAVLGINTEIYSNGIAKVLYSHNTGTEIDFWPYTLYQYDKNSDKYIKIADVETSMSEKIQYGHYVSGVNKLIIDYYVLKPGNYQ